MRRLGVWRAYCLAKEWARDRAKKWASVRTEVCGVCKPSGSVDVWVLAVGRVVGLKERWFLFTPWGSPCFAVPPCLSPVALGIARTLAGLESAIPP